jgi:pimeloyl-ACP methyl ester carboxylesterase
MKARLLPVIERAGRIALRCHGFESRRVSTRAGSVHAYVARGGGKLPPMMLLHAMGAAATPFGHLLLRLRPHVSQLIALDLPGHGFSATPECLLTPNTLRDSVRDALDQLSPEPTILVGNSLGGAIALNLALEAPERVAALALLSPAGAEMQPDDWNQLLATFHIRSKVEARRLLRRIHHRAPWYVPAFASDFLHNLQQSAVRDVLATVKPEDTFKPERLSELAMPLLLMWGQSERILPASSLAFFRKHLPAHAHIEEPYGFGHCPHLDDPHRLAARLLQFARHAAHAPARQSIREPAMLAPRVAARPLIS